MKSRFIMRRCFACAAGWASIAALHAENFVSVEAQGHHLVIDTDSDAVQRNLKPANPQPGQSKLPAWLYPYAGAVPLRAEYDVNSRMSSATFAGGGTVDQSVAYYAQLLASQGFVTSAPLGSPTSKIISGKNATGLVSVMVGIPPRTPEGAVQMTVTFKPSGTQAPKRHFVAAWYDDARGLLCLRDTGTADEYYLEIRSIAEANLNRPGAVKSEGAKMPAWLPVYPNARASELKMLWTFEPTATFGTRDSIRAVYEYYLAAVKNAGARVVENGITRSGNPPQDFSAQIVAQLGDDVVDIRSGEILGGMNWSVATDPNPLKTGIGIRYTVPKR